MDVGPWLYYKLTNGPKGSGELRKEVFKRCQLPTWHKADIWFIRPHGVPSGVWTGHRKPESDANLSSSRGKQTYQIDKQLSIKAQASMHIYAVLPEHIWTSS